MKTPLAIFFISIVYLSYSQQSSSFLSRNFIDSDFDSIAALGSYAVFESKSLLSRDIIPDNAHVKTITLNEQAVSPINQGIIFRNIGAADLDPYLGSMTTRQFQFLNQKMNSTFIFDSFGNLRSSQMSFSFGKKNQP